MPDMDGKTGDAYQVLEDSRRYWLLPPAMLRGDKSLVTACLLGQRIYDLLSVQVPLREMGTVLEVGLGDGRVTAAFARNNFEGRYFGFDIDSARIQALRSLFRDKKNFSFLHADLFHSYYNPGGAHRPESYEFAYPAESMRLIFLNSIFTHLSFPVVENYIHQCGRCLARDGLIWATFYVIDEIARAAVQTNWDFSEPHGGGFTAFPERPEGCLAYEKEKLWDLFGRAGLVVQKYRPGYWKQARASLDQHEQDVILLSRAR